MSAGGMMQRITVTSWLHLEHAELAPMLRDLDSDMT